MKTINKVDDFLVDVATIADPFIFMSPQVDKHTPLPNQDGDLVQDHSMASVIKALKAKGYT